MTINESIYMALSVSDESKVSPLLMGNPGSGKTTSVEFFAKANGMRMVLLRGSQSSPEEILGYEVNDGEEYKRCNIKVKTASKICPKWYDEILRNSENGIRTLLFLDEITTASAFVQSALLQVIFGREIDNGYRLPDDTFIVAAGNYAGNLSSEFNLIPPLMNRFCIFNVSISKDDLKSFMSRYSDRQDVVSKLKVFDSTNSTDIDSIEPEFITLVKRTMEFKLCEYVQSLISQGKFDPNYTEMSDVYQDQSSTGGKLLGILTPRTLCYYTDVSIATYLKYGLSGIESDTFAGMTSGLVGISLSNNGGTNSKKEVLYSEFVNVVSSVAKQLDKKRVSSVSSAEKRIESIVTELDTDGNKVNVEFLNSPELISIGKIFDSLCNDNSIMKLQTPIEPELVLGCSDVIIRSARNSLKSEKESILKLSSITGDEKDKALDSIDLGRINGEIKTYNDSVRAFKSVSKFIGKFSGYGNEVNERINVSDKSILGKNKFRIDSMKSILIKSGVPTSELVKTESI